MVTIHREAGLRFMIFVDDHEPAHVQAFGAGEAKINIIGANDAPLLIWANFMKRGDIKRIMGIVIAQQGSFLMKWKAIHG